MVSERLAGRAARAGELMARRFGALSGLSGSDLELIEAAARRLESHSAGADLPGRRILVSGWASRRRVMSDGARQIFSFVLPGDPCEGRRRGAVSLVALTPVETVEAPGLFQAAEDSLLHAGLAEAFEAMREEEERLLLDHIVRLGRLTAYERMAHLLLELRDRLARVGLAEERRLPMPLTQETLADALGLSIVHVNRTIQQLRREGLIELRSGIAVLHDPDALAELCAYEPLRAPRRTSGPAANVEALARATAPLA
ncbi:Crp/Fnr family transcriptional regulator [Phenylobacterium sp.]|jgi:CRP-like cAMP-binding protein|uniref:Crp/Fnr family transcriptional regulator n=1 Tax=Phenylobacterium sp. TaxID=1871053 RepID=UPI002E2F1D12|nr:Crp/Fnr family transcriptional regulator [Phenylobacterium sp.]HEX2561897.1 Crp/Fnr family transcriptional regulator [Phenylobacterium sp.]